MMASASERPHKPSRNSVAQKLQERLSDGSMHEEVYEIVVASVDINEGEPIAQIDATEAVQAFTITADVIVTVSWTSSLVAEQVNDLLDHLDEILPTAELSRDDEGQKFTLRATFFVNQGVLVHQVPPFSS